ncbi:TPA: L-valine transporter subunit YgaH [Klebsiella pneumoniae]
MNSEVLLLGVIVGGVNYLFRYLPLRLRAGHARPARRGPVSALLVVSSVPEILADAHRLAPTLTGFLVLGAAFWKTRSIIVPTLLSAFAYGLAWKITNGL